MKRRKRVNEGERVKKSSQVIRFTFDDDTFRANGKNFFLGSYFLSLTLSLLLLFHQERERERVKERILFPPSVVFADSTVNEAASCFVGSTSDQKNMERG